MTQLSLEWIEAGSLKTQSIGLNPATKHPGVTLMGRDPSRCDIVLADGSVSGLHVEIGYDLNTQHFYIQNLRDSNPPIINGQPLPTGRRELLPENIIQLGNLQIRANLVVASTPLTQEIPPTELQSFAPSIAAAPEATVPPPYAPPQSPQYAPPQSPQYYQSPASPSPPIAQVPDQSDHSQSKASKSPVLILVLGGVLLGLLLLAWPNIRGFLGIGTSTVESETTSNPVQNSDLDEAFSIAERQLFSDPSGLFELEVPNQWQSINNSRRGTVVIQGWRHPQINAYIIMRIFSTDEAFSPTELQFQAQQLVDELFSNLDEFIASEAEELNDGTIQVRWEGKQGRDRLAAGTYVRQYGSNLSALTLWFPKEFAQNNAVIEDLNEILVSWDVDPNGQIP